MKKQTIPTEVLASNTAFVPYDSSKTRCYLSKEGVRIHYRPFYDYTVNDDKKRDYQSR